MTSTATEPAVQDNTATDTANAVAADSGGGGGSENSATDANNAKAGETTATGTKAAPMEIDDDDDDGKEKPPPPAAAAATVVAAVAVAPDTTTTTATDTTKENVAEDKNDNNKEDTTATAKDDNKEKATEKDGNKEKSTTNDVLNINDEEEEEDDDEDDDEDDAISNDDDNDSTSELNMQVPDDGLQGSRWPDACPPAFCRNVFSVSIGNSRLHWAMHTGYEEHFHPMLLWRTNIPGAIGATAGTTTGTTAASATTTSSGQKKPGKPSKSNPKITLADLLPDTVKQIVYGTTQTNKCTVQAACEHLITQRMPTIYVYVVSTNTDNAKAVSQLFQGIPAILIKLTGKDFLLTTSKKKKKKKQYAYETMGVDRIANIAGAQYLYPKSIGSPLVIDGGTACTYTSATNTNKLGGGITPGLRMKFRALYDFTTDLPHLSYEYVQQTIQECETNKKPLLFFSTESNTSKSSMKKKDSSTNGTINNTALSKSIIGTVLKESSLLLCHVIRGWLDKVGDMNKNNKAEAKSTGDEEDTNNAILVSNLPTVILTGGDCTIYQKLLQPNHSYILEIDPWCEELLNQAYPSTTEDTAALLPSTTTTTNNKTFRIQKHEQLLFHGIQAVLQNNFVEDKSDLEHMRSQMLGQRVAVKIPGSTEVVRGTIIGVIRQKDGDDDDDNDNNNTDDNAATGSIDTDFFTVFYEEKNAVDDVDVATIYDALVLYNQVREKSRRGANNEERKLKLENKARDAKEAAEMLEKHSIQVQKLVESRKPKKRPPPKPAPAPTAAAAAAAAAPPAAKKAKTTPVKEIFDPKSYIGRRIVKEFECVGNNEWYFGTVEAYYPPEETEDDVELWGIVYDDGDTEDFNKKDLNAAFKDYEKHKKDDTQKKK